MKPAGIALWLLLLATAGVAAQSAQLHDVTRLADGRYKPGTTDPHFIFNYAQPKRTEGQTVWLDIRLQTGPDQPFSGADGTFFWSNSEHGFESRYSIQFRLDQPTSRVAVPIDQLDDEVNAIRIDIDRCGCLITLADPQWTNNDDQQALHYPSGLDHYLGLANGRDLAIDNWAGIQLVSPATGVFEFSAWDPRIVNIDDMAVPANIAAGIYFDFDYDFLDRFQKYEVFWRFEGGKWSALSSAHFVLPNTPQAGSRKQVFVPFEYLHSKRLLQQIRLDFQACPSCRFTLNQSRIVGFREAAKYSQYRPERLYYVHTEIPPAGFIRNAFMEKISRAKGFVIFYLLLLAGVAGFGLFFVFRK